MATKRYLRTLLLVLGVILTTACTDRRFDGFTLPDGPRQDRSPPGMDMTLPDSTLPDMALPDTALPDMTLPDSALPDVSAHLPDLVVSKMSAKLSTITTGQVTYAISVCNMGNTISGTSTVFLFYDLSSAPGPSDKPDGKVLVSSLATGACLTVKWYTFLKPGNQRSWTRADGYDTVKESDENNNNFGPVKFLVGGVTKAFCHPSKWCWQNPLPQGLGLSGVWAAGPTDVFAVGERGLVLRFNGKEWKVQRAGVITSSSGPFPVLRAIWGTSATSIYVVGNTPPMHFNGKQWQAIKTGDTHTHADVWGTSDTDVFVVGEAGTILHFDGTSWNKQKSGTTTTLLGVWGTGSSDVWAVGWFGTILHFDGTSWKKQQTPSSSYSLQDVCGTSSTNVFAVGSSYSTSGTILRYDGKTWKTQLNNKYSGSAVYCAGPSAVYVASGSQLLLHDGSKWTVIPTTASDVLGSIDGTSATNVFSVGSSGAMFHYSGTNMQNMSTKLGDPGVWPEHTAVWGSGPSNVYAVGKSNLSSAEGHVVRWDGANWKVVKWGMSTPLHDIWGSSPTDVFAVGGGESYSTPAILHFDGTSWTKAAFSQLDKLRGVWGTSATNVFAVGEMKPASGGAILHFHGKAWSLNTANVKGCLTSVWGSGPTDVFAVGDGGVILRHDGKTWQPQKSGTKADLVSVWGTSSTDVYVISRGGSSQPHPASILHYDGKSWKNQAQYPNQLLSDVWGSGATDIYVVGLTKGTGSIVHYDGKSWSQVGFPGHYLGGVWGSDPTDVFAVGSHGTILHYKGP